MASELLTEFLGAVIAAVVGGASASIVMLFNTKKAENDLLLCLARAQLHTHYRDVLGRGFTTTEEVEVYEPMYNAYRNSHGNGVIARMHDRVADDIPIYAEEK